MTVILAQARETVDTFQALLDQTEPEARHVRLGPEAWTLAEIVGHLIDSAGNNHQRFVRLAFGDLEGFPGYDTEPWVAVQRYDACAFADLARLWAGYNALLLHLAAALPESAWGHVWKRPEGDKTLAFLIEDYFAHLRLHIEHYQKRLLDVRAALGHG